MHSNKNPCTRDKMIKRKKKREKKNEHVHSNEQTVSRSMFEGGSDPHDA